MADRLQREREAFEAFARREGWTDAQLMRDERGFYFDPNVRAMWLGWAGRAADDSGAGVADECGTCRKALPDGCNTEFQGEQSCALTHGVKEMDRGQ